MKSTATLLKTVAEYCYKARDYAQLNSNIILLSKKHGQLKAAVQAIVEQAVAWLPDIQKESTERWIELLETLRSVTEGKVNINQSAPLSFLTCSLDISGDPTGTSYSSAVASP